MKVLTTLGEMEEDLLEKKEGSVENDHEKTSWVEYWYQGDMVHRSVSVEIKEGTSFYQITGNMNG